MSPLGCLESLLNYVLFFFFFNHTWILLHILFCSEDFVCLFQNVTNAVFSYCYASHFNQFDSCCLHTTLIENFTYNMILNKASWL